jgi:two-component system cell cycle sensor histidine kinase PleC
MNSLIGSFADASSADTCRRIVDALDSLRIGVALYDGEDRLTYYNTHFQFIFRSFGMMDTLIGSEFRDLLLCKLNAGEIAGPHVVSDPEGWIERRLAHRRNPGVGPLDERLTDGRWIRISERSLKDGGTISIYTDITESKAGSLGLQEAVEGGSDALAFWDQNDRLVLRNNAYVELFSLVDSDVAPGVQYKTILDNAARHLFDIDDKSPENWSAERHHLHFLPQHQESWRHRDGRWFLVDEHRSRDGGVVTRLSDVTAIKENELAMIERGTTLAGTVHQLEMSKWIFERQASEHVEALEQLARAKAAVEEASASRSRFLSIISHELRTPMNAIIGFSEILKKELLGPLGTEKYTEYAGDIFSSAHHLLSLINDLLDMSKVDAGKWRLKKNDIHVGEFVRSCCRLIAEQAAGRGMKVEIKIRDEHATAHVDERALRQVLLNLLSNAVKFTRQGGSIWVSAAVEGEALKVSVTDDGVGISPQDQARVFRPFEQVENNLDRTHEGTGLGLALCKSLVELHEGQIELVSQEGNGTTVTFYIPQESVGELPEAEPIPMTNTA